MGLYSDLIFPHLLDFVMSRPNMMEQRAQTLDESHGDVLEIGFGTGLPELAVSITAIIRKSSAIAVGNLIGSNICDLLLSLGIGTVNSAF